MATANPPRQPTALPVNANGAGQQFARLCAAILSNNATSADLYGDAHRLAVALHDEQHPLAPLACDVAITLIAWASREHCAAELAALAAAVAGEEVARWH